MKARALTKEEHEALKKGFLGQWAVRNCALWVFLYLTGYRISEALSLNVGDVVDERGEIADSITVQARHMKGRKESRTVPVCDALKMALEKLLMYLEGRGLDHVAAPLFPCPGGRLIRQEAWRIMKLAGYRAGVALKGLSTHSGRKSLGYDSLDLYEAMRATGAHIEPLLLVKQVLGHKRLDSTEHYLPRNQVEIKDAFMTRK